MDNKHRIFMDYICIKFGKFLDVSASEGELELLFF